MNDDKLVLVFYIGIGDLDRRDSDKYIREAMEKTKGRGLNDNFYIPVRGTLETRIECLNPKLVNKREYDKTLKKLQQVQKDFDDFMDSTDKKRGDKIKVRRRIKK